MEAVSHEKFKLNHLRQRIAQLTVIHEDALADQAVKAQLLTQERNELREALETQTRTVAERDAEIAELKRQLHPEAEEVSEETPESDPENSPEG